MHRLAALYSVLVLLLGIFIMSEAATPPLNAVDSIFFDWVAANTERKVSPAPLTLIEIDDNSIKANRPWPWSPLDFGLFLQAVLPFTPGTVAISQVLDWPSAQGLSPEAQQKQIQYAKVLKDSILRTPRILLGASLGYPDDPTIVPPLQEVPLLRRVSGDATGVLEFTSLESEPSEDYRLTSTLGFTNLPPIEDITRSVPTLLRYRGQFVPSFVLQAAMLWYKLTPDEIEVKLGSHISLGKVMRIPIDKRGNMLVDFKSSFARYGFDDLLLAVEQSESGQTSLFSTDLLRDRLILLSRTDEKARTLDLPTGRRGSPGEVFAAAIATIQGKTFIRRVGHVFDVVVIGVVMALAYFCSLVSKRKATGIFLIGIIAYFFIALTFFSRWRLWLPTLLPFSLWMFVLLLRHITPDQKEESPREETRAS
jgi:CHASE2 domain-containing sensor protein